MSMYINKLHLLSPVPSTYRAYHFEDQNTFKLRMWCGHLNTSERHCIFLITELSLLVVLKKRVGVHKTPFLGLANELMCEFSLY